jgi:hypothetical protein
MADRVQRIEFLENYLIIELFEKIIRIRKFIETAYEQEKKETDRHLLELYNKALSFIADKLIKFRQHLPANKDDGTIFDNMLYISQNFRAIENIHQDLKNISSIKLVPEINTFLYDIDQKEEKLLNFNLILTDNYSFKERNLGKKILHDLEESYQSKPELGNTHSFILPKIEFSNPLNWSILVHEYGHIVSTNESESYLAKLHAKGVELNSSEEQSIKNWVEEMFCDVFAAKILGPAYLVSFLSFNLLNSFDCSLDSNSHPSVYLRAENIKSFLHRNNADFSNDTEITNYGELFNDIMINIDSSFNVYPVDSMEIGVNKTSILRTFREYISEKEGMIVNDTNSNKNIHTLKLLLKKLEQGQPIGTIRDELDEKVVKLLSKKIDKLDEKDIELMKNSSIERPTSHWEILNAGWIHKIEKIKSEFIKLFFTNYERNIEDKLEEYSKYINKLDDLLLHSISTSQIIKSIER